MSTRPDRIMLPAQYALPAGHRWHKEDYRNKWAPTVTLEPPIGLCGSDRSLLTPGMIASVAIMILHRKLSFIGKSRIRRKRKRAAR